MGILLAGRDNDNAINHGLSQKMGEAFLCADIMHKSHNIRNDYHVCTISL